MIGRFSTPRFLTLIFDLDLWKVNSENWCRWQAFVANFMKISRSFRKNHNQHNERTNKHFRVKLIVRVNSTASGVHRTAKRGNLALPQRDDDGLTIRTTATNCPVLPRPSRRWTRLIAVSDVSLVWLSGDQRASREDCADVGSVMQVARWGCEIIVLFHGRTRSPHLYHCVYSGIMCRKCTSAAMRVVTARVCSHAWTLVRQ